MRCNAFLFLFLFLSPIPALPASLFFHLSHFRRNFLEQAFFFSLIRPLNDSTEQYPESSNIEIKKKRKKEMSTSNTNCDYFLIIQLTILKKKKSFPIQISTRYNKVINKREREREREGGGEKRRRIRGGQADGESRRDRKRASHRPLIFFLPRTRIFSRRDVFGVTARRGRLFSLRRSGADPTRPRTTTDIP